MFLSQEFWRHRRLVNIALLPLAAIFGLVAWARRMLYRIGILRSLTITAPVVIVGNIVAGGGGKTPLVMALVTALQQQGMTPGVVVRPVGAILPRQNNHDVVRVHEHSTWQQCGDESLVIYQRTGAPVMVSKKRSLAAQQLALDGCDVIICDDGLQHFALHRDLEICALQGDFGVGNGWLLPAGPLRESPRRLRQCDWLAIHGDANTAHALVAQHNLIHHTPWAAITTAADGFYAPTTPQQIIAVDDFAHRYKDKKIVALAGIARPQRFFNFVRQWGIELHRVYPLPDHKKMPSARFAALAADIIIMTEKDAVKYPATDKRIRVLRIHAELPPNLLTAVSDQIRAKKR